MSHAIQVRVGGRTSYVRVSQVNEADQLNSPCSEPSPEPDTFPNRKGIDSGVVAAYLVSLHESFHARQTSLQCKMPRK